MIIMLAPFSEPVIVDKPQSTRIEEPTLLCNHLKSSSRYFEDGHSLFRRREKPNPKAKEAELYARLLWGAMLEGCVGSSRGSEIDLEEDLALPRCISLTWRASNDTINRCGTHTSEVDAVVDASIGSADLHTVEDVGVLHSQFSPYAFPEKEFFGKSKILVALEGVSQVTQ